MKKIAMLLFLGLIVFSCSSRKVTARKSTPIKHKTERIVKTEKQAELEVEAANVETPSFNTLIVKSTAEYLALFGSTDPAPVINGALASSFDLSESWLILNTVALLKDVKSPYSFSIE